MSRTPDAWAALRSAPATWAPRWPWCARIPAHHRAPSASCRWSSSRSRSSSASRRWWSSSASSSSPRCPSWPGCSASSSAPSAAGAGLRTVGDDLARALRAGRRLPVSWREVGYAFLVSVVLWPLGRWSSSSRSPCPRSCCSHLARPGGPARDARLAGRPRSGGLAGGAHRAGGPGGRPTWSGSSGSRRQRSRASCWTRGSRNSRQRVADLRRSRVDLVDAFETERKRIERDLHDGVQRQLVALTMTRAGPRWRCRRGPGPGRAGAPAGRGGARRPAQHGPRHPSAGAGRPQARGCAVHGVADRSRCPSPSTSHLDDRLPGPVEAAAYFVVSEALTNVARHSDAGRAEVRLAARRGARPDGGGRRPRRRTGDRHGRGRRQRSAPGSACGSRSAARWW